MKIMLHEKPQHKCATPMQLIPANKLAT